MYLQSQAVSLLKRISFLEIYEPSLLTSLAQYFHGRLSTIGIGKYGTIAASVCRMWIRHDLNEKRTLEQLNDLHETRLAVLSVKSHLNIPKSKMLRRRPNEGEDNEPLPVPACYDQLSKNRDKHWSSPRQKQKKHNIQMEEHKGEVTD